MRIATDTATMIIYDLDQLKHRMQDQLDWWTDIDQEVMEINRGNALFVGLAEDGLYDIEIRHGAPIINEETSPDSEMVRARLHNSSGSFFIGPGESVTAEGEEPGEGRYAHFLTVAPGDYEVTITGQNHSLFVWMSPVSEFAANSFDSSPVIGEKSAFTEEVTMSLKDQDTSKKETDNDAQYEEAVEYVAGDPGLVEDEALAEVVENMCEHLEILGYELDDSEEDLLYFHEDYGYLLLEEYAGGIRFATTMEYDAERDLKLMPYEEWRGRLLDVLDHFNASASVARAYDNPESDEVVLDTWYPAFYDKAAFNRFLELWHDDITIQFEEAQEEVSETHVTH